MGVSNLFSAPPQETPIDDVRARELVRDQLAAYCQLLDDGRFAEFAQLWSEDATVHVRGEVIKGREPIRSWMESVQPAEARGRHMVANTRFLAVDGPDVECVSDFVFFARRDGGWAGTASGRYEDRWTNTDGTWRLRERRIVM